MAKSNTAKPVRVLVITGFGLNCERETACAFRMAGAAVEQVHLNDLLDGRRALQDFHILAFIGGFSFGDHLGAGTVFANRLKYRLSQPLRQFIGAGRLVIGICNGFQTLTRLGLVPALDGLTFEPEVALAENARGVFRDDWVLLKINADSPCVFTREMDYLPVPVRHGEGRFVARDDRVLEQVESGGLVVARYADPETGEAAEAFPHNPNGSMNAIAGICDRSGRVFGLMPHPEAYLSPYNHPHWTRQRLNGCLPEQGLGVQIFENGVRHARDYIV